jgi:AcrR family transcriptional regulator
MPTIKDPGADYNEVAAAPTHTFISLHSLTLRAAPLNIGTGLTGQSAMAWTRVQGAGGSSVLGGPVVSIKNAAEPARRPCARDEQALRARREEILDAATELFAEHGYSDAVTQALAERLQVGKGTLYRHFPSKRDLFLAAADRVMRRVRERVDQRIGGIADPLERIAEAIRAFLAFFAEHPQFVELLIQERALFKDRTRPTYVEHRERNVVRWRELYRTLIHEGRLRAIPPERIADVVGDLLYGTIFTNYFIGPRNSPEAQAKDILDILFHGVLSESERPRDVAGAR